MNTGRQLLGRCQVLSGIPEMILEVQVEGTFPDGTKLVTIHHPISLEDGDLELALYGSFLPVPDLSVFEGSIKDSQIIPGSYDTLPGEITLNQNRSAGTLEVTNLAHRAIQASS